jgi:hypothetical protein
MSSAWSTPSARGHLGVAQDRVRHAVHADVDALHLVLLAARRDVDLEVVVGLLALELGQRVDLGVFVQLGGDVVLEARVLVAVARWRSARQRRGLWRLRPARRRSRHRLRFGLLAIAFLRYGVDVSSTRMSTRIMQVVEMRPTTKKREARRPP